MFSATYGFCFTNLNFISDSNFRNFIVHRKLLMPLDCFFVQRMAEDMLDDNSNGLLHTD